MKWITTLLLMLLCLNLSVISIANASVHYTANTYPFTFPYSSYRTSMGFSTDQTFTSAYRTDGYWHFTTAIMTEAYGFKLEQSSGTGASLLVTDYFVSSVDQLKFSVTAGTGITTTTSIWVPTRGSPSSVLGATNWSYNPSTKILTITVLHSSTAPITVTWSAGDTTPPTYSNIGYNTTTINTPCEFSCKWQDNVALSKYIFSTNNTGSWANDTATSFTGNPAWANVTKTLTGTPGQVVGFRWYANDTSNNWATSTLGTLTLTTTGSNYPSASNPSYSTTVHEQTCTFQITWTDDVGLSTFIFSWNGSSPWTNDTAETLIGNPALASTTKTLPVTVGTKIQFRWYANDSDNQWSLTSIYSFTVTEFEVPTLGIVKFSPSWVTINPNVLFHNTETSSNIHFSQETTLKFWTVNKQYNWFGQSYSSKHYTAYCIFVESPIGTGLTINSWFPSRDINNQTEATLTLTSPISVDITFVIYSPNFQSMPTVYGAIGTIWYPVDKRIEIIGNTNYGGGFIRITATVDETEYNNPPENAAVTITNMDVGNYVFSETKYYDFQARYWDGDGYTDLATMKLAFFDGLHWVNVSSDGSAFTLESGIDELMGEAVVAVTGSSTPVDSNMFQIDFQIRFNKLILDANDVDIYLYCIDSDGASDGWDLLRTDYFNIYNVGGHSTLISSGDAGRLPGGDVFDLYAHNNSWAEATIEFRNLQHAKMLPTLTTLDPEIGKHTLKWYVNYYANGSWHTGWSLTLRDGAGQYGTWIYWNWSAEWRQGTTLIKNDTVSFYYDWPGAEIGKNITMRFWLDFWFNKANSSSVVGGRINAYYFPMKDTANAWLRWLTGSNWGIAEILRKQSMFFQTNLDEDGNVVYAQQIEMVRLGFRLQIAPSSYPTYTQTSDYDVFDLTLGSIPMEGIQTPVFDETKVPVMPQGGFLGAVWSALAGLWQALSGIFGPALLNFWNMFVNFLDTIAGAMGYPHFFSNLFTFLGNLWNAFTTGVVNFGLMLAAFLTLIASFLTKFITVVQQAAAFFSSFFAILWPLLGGAYGVGFDILGLIWQFLPLIFIGWLIYIAYLFVDVGPEAAMNHLIMVKDIFTWIGWVFYQIIMGFINVIHTIIEAIPVAE